MGTGDVGDPIITGRHVTKEYRSADGRITCALAGVDVDFYEGQITLLWDLRLRQGMSQHDRRLEGGNPAR